MKGKDELEGTRSNFTLWLCDFQSKSPGFNSPTGPDFFTLSIQCVFVSQCFFINLINHFTGLYHLFWSSHALFGVSHCLRLAKVKLTGHPQIFLTKIIHYTFTSKHRNAIVITTTVFFTITRKISLSISLPPCDYSSACYRQNISYNPRCVHFF